MNDELMHHGVIGMKWGKRKNLQKAYSKEQKRKEKLQKRHDKILNSDKPSYVYKHRKELTDDEFDKVYDKVYKTDQLKKMAYGNRSVAKEVAISTGKEACKMLLKTTLAVSTVAFLTKTDKGKQIVQSGKKAAADILKNTAVNTSKSAVNVAKSVAKTASDTVTTAAVNKRINDAENYREKLRKGKKAAKILNEYGKTVDRIIKR